MQIHGLERMILFISTSPLPVIFECGRLSCMRIEESDMDEQDRKSV